MTLASKLLSNGLLAEVFPLTFGRARLTIREPGDLGLLDGW